MKTAWKHGSSGTQTNERNWSCFLDLMALHLMSIDWTVCWTLVYLVAGEILVYLVAGEILVYRLGHFLSGMMEFMKQRDISIVVLVHVYPWIET